MNILVLDAVGDFLIGDPVRLILNVMMAVW